MSPRRSLALALAGALPSSAWAGPVVRSGPSAGAPAAQLPAAIPGGLAQTGVLALPSLDAAPRLALPQDGIAAALGDPGSGLAAPGSATLAPDLTLSPAAPAYASGMPAEGTAAPASFSFAGEAAPSPYEYVQMGAQPARAAGGSLRELDAALSPQAAARAPLARFEASRAAFDGALATRDQTAPALEPAFEVPEPRPEPQISLGDAPVEELAERPTLSFPAPARAGLLSADPETEISGRIRVIRGNEGSRLYWAQFRRGAEVDVISQGQSVFGRPTTITSAETRRIEQLDREDFRGIVPAAQLQLGVKELRAMLIRKLEEERKRFHPSDAPISLKTTVRVLRFRSYAELYREAHGADAVPVPAAPAPRTPLVARPEGALRPMSRFLPKVVYLDLDLFDGPVPDEVIADVAKLQRTGVYLVAFSRKPYAAAGSLKEKLISRMSSYQLGTLMPIRFLAVTDDGAVVSALPHGNQIEPVDVAAYTGSEMRVLEDAVQKAAEDVGISPRQLRRILQPAVAEAAGEIAGLPRREAAPHADPRVRMQFALPKGFSGDQVSRFRERIRVRAAANRLPVFDALGAADGGVQVLSLQKTSLPGSLSRLESALQERFGLYTRPGDVLLLTQDPALKAALPRALDFTAISGLSGAAAAENALGLMLGEHRENVAGDLAGSASRMASYKRNRQRYLSQVLHAEEAAELNINLFSGHIIHAAMDWVVWRLQNGPRPTPEEYEAHLRGRWNKGLREFRPVGLPPGDTMEGWLRESVVRGLSMYRMALEIADRGEILVGTEVPNFFVLKDYQRRSGDLKRRYVLHTIFDFVALRPVPGKPGEATIVIYDFKSGPAQSLHKLNKDIQVLTYNLFAREKWVGQTLPGYLADGKDRLITGVQVDFIYNAVKLATTVNRWDLDGIRRQIIRTLNSIQRAEQNLLGDPQEKAREKKRVISRQRQRFTGADLPKSVPGLRVAAEDAGRLLKGTRRALSRRSATKPKAFVALIRPALPEEADGRPRVVGFARIETVEKLKDRTFRWIFSRMTPVTPYPVDAAGSAWTREVPVRGARELSK